MNDLKITLPGGCEVPIPRWSVTFFGIIAVVGIGFGVYRYFFPVEPELISVKQANAILKREIEEYNKHIMDAPIASLTDDHVNVTMRVFEDGCLLVSRKSLTRLLVESVTPKPQSGLTLVPVLEASENGRCLNPHPGRFVAQNGEKVDRCWMPVYRSFEDGCQHVQMFNTCTNGWATNPDGSPQVKWIRCNH